MRALNRKVLRDMLSMKGQIAAIAAVIAAGIMTLIVSATTIDALTRTKDRFYRDFAFAEVFADLTRAPDHVETRIQEIPGVNRVQTRVAAMARLEVADYPDPIRGLFVSIPDGHEPDINRLFLREGRFPESERSEEVLVSAAFAEAHGLRAGDSLRAIIRGGLEELTIVGLALSPEQVYQIAPTDLFPDYERYAVLWMGRRALSRAYGMEGAFNQVALTVQRGASADRVIEELDWLLAPYGGIGAYARADQSSHRWLAEELEQLRGMARVMPVIFLAVAAFLLHVLMGRIIRTQREQIAVLKAFGYRNLEMGMHFGGLTVGIVSVGAIVGIALGAWAAAGLGQVYLHYFLFPELDFRVRPHVILLGVVVAGGAACFGAFAAVRAAIQLPPAEAMRPAAPEKFTSGRVEHLPFIRALGQPTRIIFRNLSRHPLKTSLSVLGISCSTALLLVGSFQFQAVEHMIDIQYRLVQRMDLHLTFTDPTPERALQELRHQPGVLYAEGYRAVPVRLRHGVMSYQTSIFGMESGSALRGLLDADYQPVALPDEGLLLTWYLADYLGLEPGMEVQVEILEGHQRTLDVPLAGTVDEPLGVSAYMERRALNRLMREGPAVSGAMLLIDRTQEPLLYERLWDQARVAGIGLVRDAERIFREHVSDTVLGFMMVLLLCAGSIAFAVVYNNARMALAERGRELATLRVLGFTQAEVSWILVGEIMLLTLAAIPLGWLLGTGFADALNQAMTIDMYRIPFIVTRWTYAFSAAGVVAASILSVLLMLRRMRRLDMVSALKAVE